MSVEPDAEDVAAVAAILGDEGAGWETRKPIPLARRPRKRLLVVGSPRSGTRFFAGWLQGLGMRVKHESMGQDGTVDSTFTVPRTTADPDSWSKAGLYQYRFDKVIHLVRSPLRVIESVARELPPWWWRWQEIHTGIAVAGDHPTFDEAARWWLWWTAQADRLAGSRLRVDALFRDGLATNVGRSPRKLPELWRDVLAPDTEKALLVRMQQYGYDCGDLICDEV